MHYKILQLEERPISETGKTTADDIIMRDDDRWFLSSIADYVKDDDTHNETVNGFIGSMQSLTPYVDVGCDGEEQWIVFHDGFQRAFFARLYPFFEEALNNLVKNATLDALCGYDMGALLYPLQEIVNGKYEDYIDTDGYGLRSMTQFIREIKPDTKYYLGGTVDYHC